jgi:small subunit ribosomal protein S2
MPISVRELLEAGAHFGHRTHRWNPKMRPYIYGARNGIHIINLEKTAKLWAKAEQAIIETVTRGQRLLFVGTKPQAAELVAEEATRANQHFVNRRWLGGMLTNFKTIKSRIDRLKDLENIKNSEAAQQKITKKELGVLDKEREKLARALNGITNMTGLPGMVVVVDPSKEHIAISEAKKLQIPILAIADTNCDPDGIDYLVPANDDALKSIRLFLQATANACLEGGKVFEQKIQEETRRRMETEAKRAAQKAEQDAILKAAKAAETAEKNPVDLVAVAE